MIRLAGVGASPGIAMGVAHFLGGRVEVEERRIRHVRSSLRAPA